ncbi:unnamed protein product [Effrenium voratum]|nr:unnamed protein product [Effrenium voratum]CAJ1456159.1 unnamed protein product [Effrenium voratum]
MAGKKSKSKKSVAKVNGTASRPAAPAAPVAPAAETPAASEAAEPREISALVEPAERSEPAKPVTTEPPAEPVERPEAPKAPKAPLPDPAWHKSSGTARPFRQQLKDKKFRGFICGVDAASLDDCAAELIPDEVKEPKKQALSKWLGCQENDLNFRKLDGLELYFSASARRNAAVNKLASQIAWACGVEIIAVGKLAIVTESSARPGVLGKMRDARVFESLEQKMKKMDSEAFESWYAEKKAGSMRRTSSAASSTCPFLVTPGPSSYNQRRSELHPADMQSSSSTARRSLRSEVPRRRSSKSLRATRRRMLMPCARTLASRTRSMTAKIHF